MTVVVAKPLRRGGRGGFLPKGLPDALRHTAWQTVGAGLIGCSILVAAALGSYHASDPSFDTATSGPVANFLGPVGAWFADALLQGLGLAAWLPAFALLLWGGRTAAAGELTDHLRLRFALLLAALPLVATGLAPLTLPAWLHAPLVITGPARVGGVLGMLLSGGLSEIARMVHLPAAAPLLSALFGIVGVVLAIYAFGLSRSEWAMLGRVGHGIGGVFGGLGRLSFHLPQLGGEKPKGRREPQLWDGNEREPPKPEIDDEDEDEPPFEIAPIDKVGAEAPRPMREPKRDKPLVEPRQAASAPAARPHREEARQGNLKLPGNAFQLPPLELLATPPPGSNQALDEEALTRNAQLLESVLDDFGVNGHITKVRPGPVVTLYELEPAPGTKTSRVIGLADDIARQMSALSVRIATVPGRSVIGIELPNAKRELVALRELLATESFTKPDQAVALVLGKDIGGQPVIVDLARMPHLLIAGTTGSGKSVAINTMILSLLYRMSPDQCRLIMIDPKMLELSVYDGIPHLLAPVVTEPGKAVVALKWAVREMENRYRAMSQLGVRNIASYNQRIREAKEKGEPLTRRVHTGYDPETDQPVYEDQNLPQEPLPFIVIVVDEMADLMLVAGKDIESTVQRLAQMARAAGIHLIMATQRPSVDVITGTIKANFPSRISFQVTSKIDSRTILGEQGAEQLLGQGDMLYMAAGGRIIRVHGPYVSDKEVEMAADHLRAQGEPAYIEEVTAEEEEAFDAGDGGGDKPHDELYDQAVSVVLREGKASTSFVQRHLQIGYNRAARMIERMEQEGVISRANQMGKRDVLGRRPTEDEL